MSEEQMSDSTFSRLFIIMIIVMTIMTIVIVVLASFASSDVNGKLDARSEIENTESLAQRISPVDSFSAIASDTVAPVAPSEPIILSGEEAYSSCAACHGLGIAGAPKFGLKDAWLDRISKGNDTLYNNAINGFKAMPAKGGNASLSDDSVKAAVDYMLDALK